jgi:hypothetical protein
VTQEHCGAMQMIYLSIPVIGDKTYSNYLIEILMIDVGGQLLPIHKNNSLLPVLSWNVHKVV